MQLMLRDGTLSHLATEAMGLDVAEALGVAISGDRPLPIRCGWIDLAAQNGLVRPQLAVVDNDDTELRMGDYLDLAADLCTLPRPPRIARQDAEGQLSPAAISFMSESPQAKLAMAASMAMMPAVLFVCA